MDIRTQNTFNQTHTPRCSSSVSQSSLEREPCYKGSSLPALFTAVSPAPRTVPGAQGGGRKIVVKHLNGWLVQSNCLMLMLMIPGHKPLAEQQNPLETPEKQTSAPPEITLSSVKIRRTLMCRKGKDPPLVAVNRGM